MVWEGKSASADDVDRAVLQRAPRVRVVVGVERSTNASRIARRFAALLTENKEALAAAIGRETGKPLWEARTEVGDDGREGRYLRSVV